jgi:hypothetical protein
MISIVLLVVVVGAAMATFGRSRIEEIVAKPAPAGTPAIAISSMTSEEQAFYDFVVPRMLSVSAEAQVLAKLGQEKSRNVLELQTRGNRMDDYTKQINNYVGMHPVPARFKPSMTLFYQGVGELKSAMTNSKKGMVTFDWNLVAQQVDVFDQGAAKVKTATDQIQRSATAASPTAQ